MDELIGQTTAPLPGTHPPLEDVFGQTDATVSRAGSVPRRAGKGSVALSFAQERLWFLDQIEPHQTAYNMGVGIWIEGALDAEALRRALDEIARRHESLRTTFAVRAHYAESLGQPQQVISAQRSVALPVTDASRAHGDEREAEARRLAVDEVSRPFDLEQGPLFRARLIRLAEREHLLVLSLHRTVSDGRSASILLREIAALYGAFLAGEPSPLPDLPIQYADYAAWQREWLQGERLAKRVLYWRQRLGGAPAVLELPTDLPRPATRSLRGAHRTAVLSPPLTGALVALSQREGVPLGVTLMASFAALLSRYSGQEDVVVGSLVAGRDLAETEDLVGLFANMRAVRTDLSGNPTFQDLLGRVSGEIQAAHAEYDLPFEKLVEELHPQRSLSHTPIFQAGFALEDAPPHGLNVGGLTLRPARIDTEAAMLDLTLEADVGPNGTSLRLQYSTDLFEAATIERMLGHFEVLLQGIVADPQQRVAQLGLLTDAERHELLVAWNDTRAEYEQDRLIHELLEEQVERGPEAVAVVYGPERLTYRELNARANQVAHYLQELGVGPDTLVGLCVERSPEMVIGLLGTLKAGGAYLPLDPAYPKERLAFMVEDAGVAVLLTQQHLLDCLPQSASTTICLDTGWERIASRSGRRPPCAATPENLAYVIYTSGSTGKPKGVMVTHRGLVNYLSWCTGAYAVAEGRGALVHSPVGFDLTVTSLFSPLLAGRSTVLLPEGQGIGVLGDALCNESDLSLVKITPAHLEMLSKTLPAGEIAGRAGALVIGGEALLAENLDFWRTHAPGTRLFNEYGPTETVVGCCVYEVTARDGASGAVPIGRPIANTQLYILDRQLQPVPIGVAGELYIGGDGVARGYLNRPYLTAERFVPLPFPSQPGARLYRTGDLARYLPDGNVEFLGRIDNQVKVRGFRIELGEIEAVLAAHPAVRENAVIARQDADGARLVAYVVPAGEHSLQVADLRAYLKDTLPEYMVPGVFVVLEALPLTANGKVDRRALPEPDEKRPELGQAFAAPRDALEQQLVQIWEQILGVEPIGVRDNFFELGGHSLLAVRLFARVANRLGKNLPLSTLFQAPTVEQLAQILRQDGWSPSWSSLVPIQPDGSYPPLFCVHAGGANVLIYRPLARHLSPEQPVYALQARGLDGSSEPHARVEDMAAHYIEEIRTVQPEGPYFLLGASFGGLVVFEMAHRLQARGEEVALIVMMNTACPVIPLRRRIRAHVGHLLDRGLSQYVRAAAAVIARRGKRAFPMIFGAGPVSTSPRPARDEAKVADPLDRTTRAIDQASNDYRPIGKALAGKLIYFFAEDRGPLKPYEDNRLAWGRLASEGMEVYPIPGNHSTIREEPNVAIVAEKLTACLERTRTAGSGRGKQ